MTQIQKRLILVVSILLVIVISLDLSLYTAFYRNPDQLKVNYMTLSSSLIPESMDDVSICYFTDLQYGEYENTTRTKKVFQQIKALNPDILIFGGDLFDTDTQITKETKKEITKYLNSIDAPLGKFAVLGEKDKSDPTRKNEVEDIYFSSQIEVLDNENVLLTNQTRKGVKLIGLTSSSHVTSATGGISSQTYNILVTHKPDNLTSEDLAKKSIDYAFAGHSHSTQITYPIFGGYYDAKGASTINRSKSKNLSFDYTISSGVGCTKVNARFNATPEVDYIILRNK